MTTHHRLAKHGQTLKLGAIATLVAVLTMAAWPSSPAWGQAPQSAPASVPAPPATAIPPGQAAEPATLKEAQAAEVAAQPSELTSSLFYQLLVGELTAQDGDAASAFALLLDAARKANNAELYQRATDIALQSRSGDAALRAARAWQLAQPNSREANRYVLQILIALNRIAETAEPLKTEITRATDAERPLVIGAIPRAFERASNKKLAADTVQSALAGYFENPLTSSAAWTTVGRMRLMADDTAAALLAAQRAQAADINGQPAGEGPALVGLELMDAKVTAAEVLVTNYLANNSKALPELRMGYARVLLDTQRYAEANAQVLRLTRENPAYPESWLVLGTLQLQDNQIDMAQQSVERYLELIAPLSNDARKRGLDQGYLVLAQIAERRKDFKSAEVWLSKIDNAGALVQTQARRASILASQGKLAEARKLINDLPERSPKDARAKLAAEISLLREAKEYREASRLLGLAIAKSPDDAELVYDRAMMAEKLGNVREMEELLNRVIRLKPDYHQAYNALGYSLAERNLRLPEAKALIQKALSYAPADPFIQDSLGWVEFRMGNGKQAAEIFKTAFAARPDPEIAAHYGEVLWSLGQRTQAMDIFKQGLQLGPDNDTLRGTIKRLRVAL